MVTEDEMAHYLASVFKVMYHAVPDMKVRVGVGAEQLAEVTAEHAFGEADSNRDGVLSYKEFQQWHLEVGGGPGCLLLPNWLLDGGHCLLGELAVGARTGGSEVLHGHS